MTSADFENWIQQGLDKDRKQRSKVMATTHTITTTTREYDDKGQLVKETVDQTTEMTPDKKD